MNSEKVVIEYAFGSLKNRWKILKHFNSIVNKTLPIIVACCVLHNYYEMWGVPEPRLANARIKGDNLMGFGVDRLPFVKEGKQAKTEGERLRRTLFKQWVIDHPIVLWQNNTIWVLKWNPSFYSHKWKCKS